MSLESPAPVDQFSSAAQDLLRGLLTFLGAPADSELSRLLQTVSVADSSRYTALQARYFQQHRALLQAMLGGAGGAPEDAVASPGRGDRRFSSAEWRRNPWFDYLRQSYLINARFVAEWVDVLDAEPRAKEQLRFLTRQFADAMSPANFAATNPEALKLAI